MIKVTHILYLSEKNGQNPFSGAESHVLTLLGALRRSGVDVELIVLLWYPGSVIAQRLAELEQEGVRVTLIVRDTLARWKGRLWRALECWAKLYKALRQRRDSIIHAHLDLIAVPTVARVAKCRRLVVSIHNDEPYYASFRWRLWFRIIDRWIAAYIAITEHVRAHYIAQTGPARGKIRTIYYGVEPPPTASAKRQDFGISPGDFVVGFIGRLTRQKNIGTLIEAVAQVPGVQCVIIGDGELRESLLDIVAAYGIQNVKFLGAIPQAASLMRLFDVFCLPSLWEGLGLVLVEAMLQRVPIIGSNAGAIPEILGDGRYGLIFDPKSRSSLVECLRYAKNNPQELRELAARAFERATSEFGVEQMTARTVEVYRAV